MQPNDSRPEFWIFAGPNGSGKSTAYSRSDAETSSQSFWIVNPDLLTASIQGRETLPLEAANLEAVRRLEVWLEATIKVHRSLGVETVLSTPKYRRLVTLAKDSGFFLRLIYVVLDSPERNIQRVRARVAAGGHDVPENKIVERYWRSLEQMPWFLAQADQALIYDNSGDQIRLIATKSDGIVEVSPDAFPAIAKAIRASLAI